MEEMIKLLKGDLSEYAPVPFWSWNNKLEKPHLLRQIEDMYTAGCGGFIMHARTGLRNEYLSDEWFSLVEFCLDEAKKRGMHAWIYDENGWPSGFVGGKLLTEENLAQYLVLKEQRDFDGNAFAVYIRRGGKFARVTSACGAETYYTVYKERSPSNTDILNPAVVDKFIADTHEEYFKRFGDRFGKELTGFFTDEPQFMRGETPYSPLVEEYFKERYGEDVKDNLASLFFDGEEHYEFRIHYYIALNELYVRNYYKRLYDWCNDHGCKLTGHSIEENKYFAQMWGSAGVSPTYEYEHVPAIDNLGTEGDARLAARQAGSVAAQTGKKQILTETFGCCGYGATPAQLKAIAEKQYVHGVNLLCHHLFAYSLAGQGKTDHPPCFSPHMTWWKEFSRFNEYFTRLGFLIANSSAQVNCAVLSPMSEIFLHYNVKDETRARKTDDKFEALQALLNRHGILYELADEQILKSHGVAENGVFGVGLRRYEYVVVPDCENFSANTKRLLKEYCAQGGKIFALSRPQYTDGIKDDWSFLKSNVTPDDIAKGGAVQLKTDGRVEYTYRVSEEKNFRFLYLVNPESECAHVTIPEGYSRLDPNKLTLTLTDREITLVAGEGAVFVPEWGEPVPHYLPPQDVTDQFVFAGASANNLTLDTVSLCTDGVFGGEEPVAEAFDRLLRSRYRGKLNVRFTFFADGWGNTLRLRREKGNYIKSELNGVPLAFEQSEFDVMFEEAEILGAMKKGRNVYEYETDFFEREEVYLALYGTGVSESLRNCLTYDTELENVYLIGDFTVKNRTVCAPEKPSGMNRLDERGYPYFAGEVRYRGELDGRTERARIALNGNFCIAEIYVNGKSVGSCCSGGGVDLSLKAGQSNGVEIVFSSTLRNMFGPFHWAGNPYGVSPVQFNMRGLWKEDGTCEYFDPAYKTEPFGIERVEISYEEQGNKS